MTDDGAVTAEDHAGKQTFAYSGAAQDIYVTFTTDKITSAEDLAKSYTLTVVKHDDGDVVDTVNVGALSSDHLGNAVASAVVSLKDAGAYDVFLSAPGGVSVEDDSAINITAASFADCEFELTSASYAKDKTPEIAKITLNGNDVTSDFEGKMPTLFFYENADQTDLVNPFKNVAAGTYYAFAWANSLTGNITVSQSTYLGPVEFKVTDATAPEVAFANGKAVAGVDQDGKAVEADEKGAFSVVSDGENPLYVIPTSIIPEGGQEVAVELVDAEDKASNFYGVDSNGDRELTSIDSLDDLMTPGKYYVAVKAKGESSPYAGAICYVPMTVKAHAFDSVSVVNNADGENDVDNATFTYNGITYKELLDDIAFSIDGEFVDANGTARLFNSAGVEIEWDNNNSGKDGALTVQAGTYTVTDVIGTTPVEATFTVEKLDLSKAVVVASDVEYENSLNQAYTDALNSVTVNGKHLSIAGVEFSVSPITKVGAYKATLSAAANQQNVTGSATVDFNVVADLKKETVNGSTDECFVTYANVAWNQNEDADNTKWDVRTFAATGAGVFSSELVGLADSLEDCDYTVTVLDEDGNEVAGALAANKVYTVVVRITPDSKFSAGGTFVREIKVEDGDLADCDVTVTYKGDVVEGVSADYTGKNVIDDVAVAVKDGKKVLTEGTEYELVLKNAKGEVVEEAVESGLYTLEVRGLTYSGSVSIPVAVGDMQVTALRVQPSDMGVIAWTGEAVTPVIEYTLDSQAKIDAGTAEWTVLPSDFYVAKYENAKTGKAVSEVVDEGDYKVTITPSTKIDNMTLPAENVLEFAVSKTVAGFVDVSTSAWYANVVAKANDLEYMTGISGTAMFAPNATITRAEVAEVFAKMAGLELDKDKTYPTKFADVASDAWFAQSVAWASQAGIVGGYEGTDLFGSFDNATREQVATMIYRYAAVAGLDTSVEDEAKALSAYADAGQLTFGKTAMAWCVEQGIMGVDTDSLNPLANMSRAEMAATAVRVQPEAIA